MKHSGIVRIITLASVFAPVGAHADDKFTINGFGFQDYRQSNANVYEGADKRGTWENGILALVMSARLSDQDTVWAQLESKPTEPTEFTWAYVAHRFNSNLSVRVGRIKFPQGFYNEFIDNKALQISAIRPSVYSFRADMVHDAYSGVGVNLNTEGLVTQIYGGVIYTPAQNAAVNDGFNDRRMIGTRITWNSPIEGLHFMVTGIEAQVEDNNGITATPPLGQLGKEYRATYSVEYVTDQLDIKAEHNTHKTPFQAGNPLALPVPIPDSPANTTTAWYVQGSYKIGLWSPYARFDYFIADQHIASDPSSYQKDWVVGVNYQINENMNARIEDHVIQGYGLSVASGEIASSGKTKWNMMAAEINFVF